ncbi:MAG: aminotransferase class I/II-fold pyridoxal phosphate-dependent enzyme [Desulfobacterales bacterium]|nr:aminotransferase class I/II-fold pyridoxal phosphate-dependent enzyme [Desulfobacterales bacterium]
MLERAMNFPYHLTSQKTSTLVDLLNKQSHLYKNKAAYHFTSWSEDGTERDIQLSYAELESKAKAIAGRLIALKATGKRALLLYNPGLEYISALFGCFYAGVIAVPAYPPLTSRLFNRFKGVVTDSNIELFLTVKSMEDPIKSVFQEGDWGSYKSEQTWLTTDDNLEMWKEHYQPLEIEGQTVAMLQYTSGSTSDPKGVVLTHENLIHNMEILHKCFETTNESVLVSWLPFYHDMGLIGTIFGSLYCGGEIYLFSPMDFLQNPFRWLNLISKTKATISASPNFGYDLCVKRISESQKKDLDLSHWKIASNGAEPIRENTLLRFSRYFKESGFDPQAHFPCYGQAESTLAISCSRVGEEKPIIYLDRKEISKGKVKKVDKTNPNSQSFVSIGKIAPDTEINIADPFTLEQCSSNEIGEIWSKSRSVAKGYWDKSLETEETFQAYIKNTDDGPYLRTGDLGFVIDDHLYFAGRFKDLIIFRGQNIYPQDIEQTIEKMHASLRDGCNAVFSLETEALIVVQEVKKGIVSVEELEHIGDIIHREVIKQHGFQISQIVFIKAGSISKTTSGKIQRHLCKKGFLSSQLNVTYLWKRDKIDPNSNSVILSSLSLEQKIQMVMVTILSHITKIPLKEFETDMDDFEFDSITLVELISNLNRLFSIDIAIESMMECNTIELASIFLASYYPEEFSICDDILSGLRNEGLSADDSDKSIRSLGTIDLEALEKYPFFEKYSIIKRNCEVTKQELRRVKIEDKEYMDFASCNYLGFDYHPDIMKSISPMIDEWGVHPSWTRAVASPAPYLKLEQEIAKLIGAPSTLLFPNIAMLNFGILPILAAPNGVIIADTSAHNTIQEACELAAYRGITFVRCKHADPNDLEKQLKRFQDKFPIIIAVDGVYSMSVKYLDLPVYSELAKKYNAYLYVDDAHGFGLIGESPSEERPFGYKGNGIVRHFDMDYVEDHIIYIAGLSKAYSSHAAFVTCLNDEMREKFQMASTYIFSGPVPVATLASGLSGLKVNESEGDALRSTIFRLSEKLVIGAKNLGFEVDNSHFFPIIYVVIGDMENTLEAIDMAQTEGLLLTPGVFPAVPLNRGGLRFTVTALNTDEEIDKVINVLERIKDQILL